MNRLRSAASSRFSRFYRHLGVMFAEAVRATPSREQRHGTRRQPVGLVQGGAARAAIHLTLAAESLTGLKHGRHALMDEVDRL